MKRASPSRSRPDRQRFRPISLLIATCLSLGVASSALGQSQPSAGDTVPLVLEVRVNGLRSELLWQFDRLADGSLATSAERLRLLGFDLARLGVPPDASVVRLADLRGVTYHYSEATQSLEIDAKDDALTPVVLDAANAPEPIDLDKLETHLGAVLNYGLFMDVSREGYHASGQYDARLMTGVGVFSSNGYANYTTAGSSRFEHVRLDTSWRYVDAKRVIAFAAGDVISDGGDLGQIYRLGGLQVRREFGERPDIVTTALPILSGTAAVPSMVDLYVNGLRYYNGQVGRGPFEFRSLPNLGNGATATVVLTDATGRETRIEKPIFYVPDLLPRGMLDFSLEAGFPRLNYGIDSFDYLDDVAASGTLRYGVNDWLTAGAHVEGMHDFLNGSAEVIVRVGGLGSIRARGAASHFREVTDHRFAIDASARIYGVNLYAGIDRAKTGYRDLVGVTSIKADFGPIDTLPRPVPVGTEPALQSFSTKTDRAGASFSLFDTGFALNYTRMKLPQQDLKLISGSFSRTLFGRLSAWGNAYKDVGDRSDYGVFFGFSLSFQNRVSATTSFSKTQSGSMLTMRANRATDGTPGSWGWTVSDSEILSGRGTGYRAATVRYLGRAATLEGGIEQQGSVVRLTGYAEGSVVAMGGGVFLAPRIDDGFAIVRGGGARTPVLANRREVARTNQSGKALVPYIPAYQRSTIGIDPVNLPVDLRPARTEAVVVPADRAGVIVDFGVAPIAAAVVTLVDTDGAPLPVGAIATLEDGEPTVIGYDGQAYVAGLKASNRLTVELENGGQCSVTFEYRPVSGQQVKIGPLICR